MWLTQFAGNPEQREILCKRQMRFPEVLPRHRSLQLQRALNVLQHIAPNSRASRQFRRGQKCSNMPQHKVLNVLTVLDQPRSA